MELTTLFCLLFLPFSFSRLIAFGNGEFGKLGDGNALPHVRSLPCKTLFYCQLNKDVVSNIQEGINFVSTGTSHSLAVDSLGNAYSFGSNEWGMLCVNETQTTVSLPTIISWFSSQSTWIYPQITIRYPHTKSGSWGSTQRIFRFGAHVTVGRVFLCGNGANGVLGDNIVTPHNVSTPYMLPIQEPVADIAAGDFHTILKMSGGDIRTFGNPTSGVLCSLYSQSIPTVVIPANSIGGISLIAASRDFSLFMTTDGLYGCGNGFTYQFGTFYKGMLTLVIIKKGFISQPSDIFIPSLNVAQISSGDTGTMVLFDTGEIYACGVSDNGQLGNGASMGTVAPLSHSLAFNESNVGIPSRISLGATAAIVSDGLKIHTIGAGFFGELGNGVDNFTETYLPIQVPLTLQLNERIISVDMGHDFALVGTAIFTPGVTTGVTVTTGGIYGCPEYTCLGALGNQQCVSNTTSCLFNFCDNDEPFYCTSGANTRRQIGCIRDPQLCPLSQMCNNEHCWDGTCADTQALCTPVNACPRDRPLRCSGYCSDNLEPCNSECSSFACEDGTCVPSRSFCPPYHGCPVGKIQCPDGSCAIGACITCASGERCFDGTCQPSCPEVRYYLMPQEFSVVVRNDQDNTIPIFSSTEPRSLLSILLIPGVAVATPVATVTIRQVSLGASNPYWSDPTSSNIASPVIDISVTEGSLSFSSPVSITFLGDYIRDKEACLAYISSQNSWTCQDSTLVGGNYYGVYTVTGDTTHFTAFAVLFIGNEVDSSSNFEEVSRPYYVIGVVFGILIVTAGITAGIIMFQKRKKRFQATKDALSQQIEMYAKH